MQNDQKRQVKKQNSQLGDWDRLLERDRDST